jgi:hydroxymethylglutaryl-CoA lyase
MDRVEVIEVGPRDGLQNLVNHVPAETKVAFIQALIASGIKRMEAGSFVSPRAIPQMSDMEEVARLLGPLSDIDAMVLVPNAKGARRAIAAGFSSIQFVISMSNAHNLSNVRRPTNASIADLRALLDEIDPNGNMKFRVGLATSFHCPFEGLMDEDQVLRTITDIVKIRDGFELTLSDTTGMALPQHVRRLCARVIAEFGDRARYCYHGHDTAGFGISNILAAADAGIRSFDGAAAGLGGCPFAPGATGNIATEDIIYTFHRMGVETGIDLDKFLVAAKYAANLPGALTGGHVRNIPSDRLFAL